MKRWESSETRFGQVLRRSEPPPLAAVNVTFVMIFGRTDLRTSLSRAKFDPEADFDVRFAVARQNPHQIGKKQNFPSNIFTEQFFCSVGNSDVRNRLKCILAKFRTDPSQV